MTEPSQYFKGRTVQEQMNEVIGYVDARAEEVAAAKADDVLEPAEQAKDDAIAAKEAAEQARDTTLAALPAIQQDIADLKAEDVSLDRRLDTVELKVQTAEGNIVTIQGQIVALQTADGQNVKLTGTNGIGTLAVLLTDNQDVYGIKNMKGSRFKLSPEGTNAVPYIEMTGKYTAGTPNTYQWFIQCKDINGTEVGDLILSTDRDGNSQLSIALRKNDGTTVTKIISTVN